MARETSLLSTSVATIFALTSTHSIGLWSAWRNRRFPSGGVAQRVYSRTPMIVVEGEKAHGQSPADPLHHCVHVSFVSSRHTPQLVNGLVVEDWLGALLATLVRSVSIDVMRWSSVATEARFTVESKVRSTSRGQAIEGRGTLLMIRSYHLESMASCRHIRRNERLSCESLQNRRHTTAGEIELGADEIGRRHRKMSEVGHEFAMFPSPLDFIISVTAVTE